MNEQNNKAPEVTARYKLDIEDLTLGGDTDDFAYNPIDVFAAVEEYEETTDCYIIDVICSQKDFEADIPISSIERLILGMVLASFRRLNFDDIIINRDWARLKRALMELGEMPEIKRSEKLSLDIGVVLARLDWKKERFEFPEDMRRLVVDWILLDKYSRCTVK